MMINQRAILQRFYRNTIGPKAMMFLLVSALFLMHLCAASGKTFTLASKKFVEGDMLPTKYTCDGKGVSPPLYWENAPSDTAQFMITRSNIYDTKLDLTRYDWMVYGISKNKDNIDTDGSEKIGKLGGCSPGVEYIYRSSCSEGQGIFTLLSVRCSIIFDWI